MMFRSVTPILLAAIFCLTGCNNSKSRAVIYCAQDQEFAELLLREFTNRTGIDVAPKYDTEAAKSVGLAMELAMEAKRPRCDVHWNNEILGTIRLQRQGVYEPYASPSAEPFPAWAKPADRTWTAFASRARAIVVNTQLVAEADRPKSLLDLANPKWKGKVAMAKPLHGTTATHAACLFETMGPDAAKEYFKSLKANDLQVVAGNKHVAEGVARGRFAIGITDTDDALVEISAKRPLAMILPDRDGNVQFPKLGVLYIPNTVAVVKNCPNSDGAKKLVDYLLSSEVEANLGEGPSHQIPLNPLVKVKLPIGLLTPDQVKVMQVDWEKAADRWEESQRFLADEFGK